jgi:hypothetical protein
MMISKEKQHDMGIRHSHHHSLLFYALWFGLISGISGVVIDADHWLNLTAFRGWGLDGRPLHVPVVIIACCLGLYSYTRIRGCATRMVLKWAAIMLAIIAVLIGVEILWANFMWNV